MKKYNRRIKRFYETIQNNEKILLIWFTYDWKAPNDEILDLCQKVCEKFGKEIDFLIIEHDENMKIGEVKRTELAKNILRYHLYIKSWDEDGNLTTRGRKEDCDPIFKQYKVIIPLRLRLKKLALTVAIKLIPTKKTRKRLRKKYLYYG